MMGCGAREGCTWTWIMSLPMHVHRPSPVARLPSHNARRQSPVARLPSPIARRPSPVTRRLSPVPRPPSPVPRPPSPITYRPLPIAAHTQLNGRRSFVLRDAKSHCVLCTISTAWLLRLKNKR